MLQIISPKTSKIVVDSFNPEKNIEMIKTHIKSVECKNMTVDISAINIMDACMIATVCSTEHYLKYPNGKINWIVNSDKIREYTSQTSLGNTEYEIV